MAADVQAQRRALDRSFSTSSLMESPASSDQDPSAMTIEFLRARLSSERSVSKAARQRAEQLAKKVSELEQRLEAEIQLRKKLESARLEVLSKYTGELNKESWSIFDSNLLGGDCDETTGELKDNSHAGGASSSRSDDIERWERERAVGEAFSQPIALEDDEGSQIDDGNEGSMNDDEELDQIPEKDKGILAWGSRGVRRQQSMERYARSFSPKSYEASDAESPHKRWIGKSVRQKRKTDIRCQNPNSEELEQTQDREDVEENPDQPEDKQDMQYHEERDTGERHTEVERVLERQAEFIERFEEEENAQNAWEENFREQNPSIRNGVDIHQNSKEESSIGNLTGNLTDGDNAKAEAGGATSARANENLSSHQEAVASVHFGKAHRFIDDAVLKQGVPPASSQTVRRTTLDDANVVGCARKQPTSTGLHEVSVTADALQDGSSSSLARAMVALMEKRSQERLRQTSEEPRSNERGDEASFLAPSQEQIDSSDAGMKAVERDIGASSDRYGGLGKLDRQSKLSSSFKFMSALASPNQNFSMLTENVPSTSPELQDIPTPRYSYTENVPSSSPEWQNNHTGRYTTQKKIQSPTKDSVRTEASFGDQAEVGSARRQSPDEVQPRTVSREEISFRKPSAQGESTEQDQEGKGFFGSTGVTANKDSSDLNLQVSRTTSNQTASQRTPSVFANRTNDPRDDAAVQSEEVAEIPAETTQRGRTQSQWKVGNESTEKNSNHGFSDNRAREDIFSRRKGAQETSQQEQAGGPRTSYGFSAYPDLLREKPTPYANANYPNRVRFDNFPTLAAGRRGAIHDGYSVGRNYYQDTAFTSHRKSVDGGFDRVMDVLKALQIAKQHIQSSDEESDLISAYDGRDAYPVEPGSYSSTPKNAKASHSRAHVRKNGSSLSQPPPTDHHALKAAEQKLYWVPNGVYNSNVYPYNTRQPSWC